MVATFKSLRQPLLLLISVPFAATGAILLQIITGVPLGVASLIGVLMLIGIVVTNAIVLVDLVNQYRTKGLTAHDATVAGGARRLRPILMTALATIFALTPMALGITGHGGFISQPLAIVVIGGLISSTVLTLLVLPTLYNLVEGAKERRAARRGEKTDAVDSTPRAASPRSSAPAGRGVRAALSRAASAAHAKPALRPAWRGRGADARGGPRHRGSRRTTHADARRPSSRRRPPSRSLSLPSRSLSLSKRPEHESEAFVPESVTRSRSLRAGRRAGVRRRARRVGR